MAIRNRAVYDRVNRQRALKASLAPLVKQLETWAESMPGANEAREAEALKQRNRSSLRRSKKVPRQVRPPKL